MNEVLACSKILLSIFREIKYFATFFFKALDSKMIKCITRRRRRSRRSEMTYVYIYIYISVIGKRINSQPFNEYTLSLLYLT